MQHKKANMEGLVRKSLHFEQEGIEITVNLRSIQTGNATRQTYLNEIASHPYPPILGVLFSLRSTLSE